MHYQVSILIAIYFTLTIPATSFFALEIQYYLILNQYGNC